ncbi:MAG: phage tail protein I [Oscillospiraceae bacterium]|nr:phage tail protein I [Oscillospiraceae bacterium]
MSKYVTDRDAILATFPGALARDDDKLALVEGIADEIAQLMADTDKAAIFTRMDELDEPLLDILAADLKVDWYDYEGTLEEKRKTIRECIDVHRYKGTKFAVETALRGVYDNVKVSEWFEYGGEPFHFMVTIYDSSNDVEKRQRVLDKVKYYKNLRSVLDDVVFVVGANVEIPLFVGVKMGSVFKKIGSEVKIYEAKPDTDADVPLYIGVKVGSIYKNIGSEVNTYGVE